MSLGKRVHLALAGYLILHAILRLWVAESAELDEAEQLVMAQELRWGYASQPPLYTWLQAGAFAIFGLNLFALVLVKGLLLFALGAFLHASAWEVTRRPESALVATAALAFIPQFVWESQRDLTHSVIATSAAAASLLAFLKFLQTRRPGWSLAFGAAAGLGMLGKYNTGVFLAALLAAAWSMPRLRDALVCRAAWPAAAAFAVVTGPHLAWMADQPEAVLTQSSQLFAQAGEPVTHALGQGLGNLLIAFLSFFSALLAIFGLTRWRAIPTQTIPARPELVQLLGRTLLCAGILSLVVVLACQVQIKSRWLQPIFFAAPIWLSAQAAGWLDSRRRNALLSGAAAAALVAMAGTVLQPLAAAQKGKPTRMTAPMAGLATSLAPNANLAEVILADSRWIGGNLRLHFPGPAVLVPEFPSLAVPTQGPWLAVWDATKRAKPPKALLELARQKRGVDLSQLTPHYVEAPYRYLPQQRMKLGWMALPAPGQEPPSAPQ